MFPVLNPADILIRSCIQFLKMVNGHAVSRQERLEGLRGSP